MMAKRPVFRTQDSHKKRRVSTKWRRPRGLHNKVRLSKMGYGVKVKPGYRSPVKDRYKKEGKLLVRVNNVQMLNEMTSDQKIIIASAVGLKKRVEIVKEAQKKNIMISGMKDPAVFLTKVEDGLKRKKESKEKRLKEKEKKQKEKESKAKEKEAKEKEEKSEKAEEKEDLIDKINKDEEKKEKEKVLTKKDAMTL
ncbi:MAG: eL32 family ribosomal protein [Nanoarchaeota archaeon]